MKIFLQLILQKVLGYHTYLILFSFYSSLKIRIFNTDKEFSYFVTLIKNLPGNTIIDIGANIGITVSILAKKYPQYQLFAFEPVRLNYLALRDVIRINSLKNVTLFQKAIGESNREVEIVTPVLNQVKKQGLSHIVDSQLTADSKFISEKIQMLTLDEVFQGNDTSVISAIKIDVENYEYFVLQGAKNTLIKHRPVVFAELWDNHLKNECLSLMRSLNYDVKVLEGKSLVPYEKQNCLNYFFIPL